MLRIDVDTSDPYEMMRVAYVFERLRRWHNALGEQYAAGELSESDWEDVKALFHERRSALADAVTRLWTAGQVFAAELPDDDPRLAHELETLFEEV